MKPTPLCRLGTAALSLAISLTLHAADSDWPHYGNNLAATKYAALDQINADSIAGLELAWRWASPDNAMVAANHAAGNMAATPGAYKVTPIAIDGTLYVSTSMGQVAAIDAVSGEQRWVFDSGSSAMGRPANLGYNHRGVSFWRDGAAGRIVMPTNDAMLWLLDAESGEPVVDFGEDGRVDLTVGLGREVDRRAYSQISAPLIFDDLVIVGSSIHDVPMYMTAPPGHVRAFDLRSGEQVWRFNTIPQAGEFGNETWHNDAWQYTGGVNVWSLMSADEELGLVYLPVGTPSNDWYGGHRPGDNLFADSLVAVDARTGERAWHFQFVRHGLWDYDTPAAPTLLDITVDGRDIKAVAQVTKQSFLYVFDRESGEPVWPIEDRPVPQSLVPGEYIVATQPHPTWPLPFDRQGLDLDDLIDFTPELYSEAQEIVARFDYGPLFTPPSLRGTINLPGWMGGGNWQGAAVDPESNILYVPSMTAPVVAQLVEPESGISDFHYIRGGTRSVTGPRGLPLTKPPYGRIVAYDMNSGDQLWTAVHGDGPRQRLIDMGIEDPGPLGAASHTGPLLTSALLFIAQQDGRRSVLRAFDKLDGTVIHEIELPGVPAGTPMSYQVDGRQYIALAIGGGLDAEVVTYALP